MKLWLLQAVNVHAYWEPWYDKTFGMVVRAKNEKQARLIAAENAAGEKPAAWLDATASTCEVLTPSGSAGFVIQDHAAA